jgi:type VI secretion system secreted protein VgrG
MLGFRYNDPNRPFVIGSLFNGTTGVGGSSNNNIKSIFTRTGSTITFDEEVSSILVKDPSGNTWFMDGAGNIEVTAPKNFTVNAGENISFTAGMNITNTAGMNIAESAGVDKSSTVGMMHTLFVGGDSMMNVTGKLTEIIEGDVHSEVKNDHTTVSEKKVVAQTEKNHEVHTNAEISHNAAEKSKTN